MIPLQQFPRLTEHNHRVSSPETGDYNCVAWAAGDTGRWWQPGVYWPSQAPTGEYDLTILQQMFAALGYEICADAAVDAGFEKVALYATNLFYTHAARQLPNGKWTSKLGRAEDIEHDTPDDVAGGVYGEVLRFMKRPVQRG